MMLKSALLAPPPIDASAEFDVERAMGRLERILGDERPHPVDTDANDAVRVRLLEEIRAIGYEPAVRDDFACRHAERRGSIACARVRNILFPEGPAGGAAILVASHYDSVAAGPGAADDGAGDVFRDEYNQRRRHSTLDYRSPAATEREAAVDAALPVDAKNASTGGWKTAQNAVSHSAHSPSSFLSNEGGTNADQLSQPVH